jgi:hypothetical protein
MTSIGMGHTTASGRSRHAGTVFAVIKTRKRARGRLTGGMENKRAQIILRRRARLGLEGLLADRNTQRKIGKRAKILALAWPGWCPLVGCSFSGMIAAIGSVGLVDQAAAAGSPTISSSRRRERFQRHGACASLGKLVVSFERDGAKEPGHGVFVLQDADDLGASFDFAVRTLLRRGGINLPPIIFREDIPSPGSGEIGKLLA